MCKSSYSSAPSWLNLLAHRLRCFCRWRQLVPSLFHSCPSIPLILFPVPLALRSYLRSLLAANRWSPSLYTDPSLSLQAPAPSLPLSILCARLLTQSLSHFHTHSRSHTQTHASSPAHALPPPSRLGAVSFTSSTH